MTESPTCPLCGRPMIPEDISVNFHHLIPRSFGGRQSDMIHRVCHSKIHAVFTDHELNTFYHTWERLREHPEIAKFIKWLRKKPPQFDTKNRWSKQRKRK